VSRVITTAAAVVIGAAMAAAAAGTATGTFTVKGKPTKLAHAYATAKPDLSDKTKTKEEVEVTLTDVPLDAAVLNDPTPFGLGDLAKANKLHGIRFSISPDKAVTGTLMYDAAFGMRIVSVAGTYIKLDLQTFNKTTVAGKLYTSKPLDFNDVPFEYSISFNAPITR
jgi:hypothetical protein